MYIDESSVGTRAQSESILNVQPALKCLFLPLGSDDDLQDSEPSPVVVSWMSDKQADHLELLPDQIDIVRQALESSCLSMVDVSSRIPHGFRMGFLLRSNIEIAVR